MVADVANATTPGGGKNAGRKKHKFTPFHAPTQQKAESMRDQALDEWLHAPQRAPHTSATSPGTSVDGQGTCFTLEPAPPFIPLPDLRLAPVLRDTRVPTCCGSGFCVSHTPHLLHSRYRASRHTSEAQSRDCAWRTRRTNSCEQLEDWARSRSSRRRARARGRRRRSCDLISLFL